MTAINRILIVDDEDNVRRMLSTAFVGYLYSKMALVHLFPPMQDDKYHGRIENHQSGKSLEFHTVPFILPYHFAKF